MKTLFSNTVTRAGPKTHTQHLQRVHTSAHLELGSRPAHYQARHQIQIFLLAVAFPQAGFTTYSSWHRCHRAWERPRDHQPFLPVTLILEKRPYLTCTASLTGHLSFSQTGGSCGAPVLCTAWPIGTIPISLCWPNCHSPSVVNTCQEFLGDFK